jgi:hypothetical protein
MVPIAATVMGKALSKSYGAGQGKSADSFFESHIDGMKASSNPTIERTGRVLEAVKVGFGVGYLASVVTIATGQLILGSTLDAVVTVGSAATLTNPVAATCAAVGAIFYGYHALSNDEKQALIETVSRGFEIGIEVVRAIIRFCIENLRQLLSDDNLKDAAESFGGTWAAVTGAITDAMSEKITDATILVGEVSATAGRTVTAAASKAGLVATASFGYVTSGVVTAAAGVSEAISFAKSRVGFEAAILPDPSGNLVAENEAQEQATSGGVEPMESPGRPILRISAFGQKRG